VILALDTSTATVGMALYDGVQVIGESIWQTSSHHTVEVAPALSELFNRCRIKPADLEGIAVALGPGSFTSLRIGLAIAKGLAMAVRIPLVGIPTLNIIAAAQPLTDFPLVAVLQAGRGRLAVGWYKAGKHTWESSGEIQVSTVDELSEAIEIPALVCGELTAAERQVLARKRKNILLASPASSLRRPSFLAELAWRRFKTGKIDEVNSLAPIYLHTAEEIPA